jgi:sigma-B regulation protein RsbU (phosphoserine phosphatase)
MSQDHLQHGESIYLFVFQTQSRIDERTANAVEQYVKALLQGDIAAIALGVIITVIGLSAIALHLFRARFKNRLLLWFGLVAGLYGLRLLASTRTIQLLVDVGPLPLLQLRSAITAAIPIPCLLYTQGLYGPGWKSSVRWLVWIQTIYAAVAILANLIEGDPSKAPDPTIILFFPLLSLVLVLGYVFGYRPPKFAESRILLTGLLAFIATVLNEHLVASNMLPWSWRVEPLGFFIFTSCLGYIAARRFFINEQQLLEFNKEMEDAMQIQTSILPQQMPRIEGLQIATRYLPMTAVAGDFYDFLIFDNKRLGILVADVSGHGVPAALVASMVKVALASLSAVGSDPSRVISGLNQILCKQLRGPLVTAGYLYLNMEKARALYCGAGHPPLLIWQKASHSVRELSENGLILGVRANEEYSNVGFGIGNGDRILMYTDGVVEASNEAEEFFGETRLKETMAANEELSSNDFATALLNKVHNWAAGRSTGGAQSDDITVVSIDVMSIGKF